MNNEIEDEGLYQRISATDVETWVMQEGETYF